jgi:hypothetical protein
MIAYLLAVTFSVNQKTRKATNQNIAGDLKLRFPIKKQGKLFAEGDPVDSDSCYAAYLVVYNGLEYVKGDKIKGQQTLDSKNVKIQAVTAPQIEAFQKECAATAIKDGECDKVVIALNPEAIGEDDQKNFKEKCEIKDPSPAGGDDTGSAGNFTFSLSNLLLFLSLALVDFYFHL